MQLQVSHLTFLCLSFSTSKGIEWLSRYPLWSAYTPKRVLVAPDRSVLCRAALEWQWGLRMPRALLTCSFKSASKGRAGCKICMIPWSFNFPFFFVLKGFYIFYYEIRKLNRDLKKLHWKIIFPWCDELLFLHRFMFCRRFNDLWTRLMVVSNL